MRLIFNNFLVWYRNKCMHLLILGSEYFLEILLGVIRVIVKFYIFNRWIMTRRVLCRLNGFGTWEMKFFILAHNIFVRNQFGVVLNLNFLLFPFPIVLCHVILILYFPNFKIVSSCIHLNCFTSLGFWNL